MSLNLAMRLGAVAGSSAWTPASLAGLQAWYDASDAATITESGGAVSQWNDKSSNARHVTQGTAGNRPTTGAFTKNGLNVIQFAANDNLNAATASHWNFLHNGTAWIFGLVLYAVEQSPRKNMAVFSTGVNASGNAGVYATYSTEFLANPTFGVGVRVPFVGDMTANCTLDVLWKDQWNIGSGFVDADLGTAADRIKIARNADSTTGSNASSATPATSDAAFPLRLGFDTSTNDFRLGELVIATGTDADRILVRDYLNTKWAVY